MDILAQEKAQAVKSDVVMGGTGTRESLFDDEYPVYALLSIVSLSFGVKSLPELTAATVGGLIQQFMGGHGIDGIISATAGILLAKKRFYAAAFPSMFQTWKSLKEVNPVATQKFGATEKAWLSRELIFFVSFYLAYAKFI